MTKITPIFKSGPKIRFLTTYEFLYYHIFSKILEKLMATRLSTYLDRFSLLSLAQFGFPNWLTWQTNVHGLIGAMNSNKYSLGGFFDIYKAFDAMNHSLLSNKLEHVISDLNKYIVW